MSVDNEADLPEAGSAPLIIDAEFTEVEDKGLPPLDTVDEISTCLLYTSPSPRDRG